MAAKWADAFSVENLKVLLFEDLVKSGEPIVSQILAPIDRQLADLAADTLLEPHTSLPAVLIEFKRLSNRLGDSRLVPFLEEAQRHGIGGPPFRLNPRLAKAILDPYRESNRRVARKFLGGAEGELFDEDDLEPGKVPGADYTGALPVESLAMLLAPPYQDQH